MRSISAMHGFDEIRDFNYNRTKISPKWNNSFDICIEDTMLIVSGEV